MSTNTTAAVQAAQAAVAHTQAANVARAAANAHINAAKKNQVIDIGMTKSGKYVANIPRGEPIRVTAPTEAELMAAIKRLNPVSGMSGIKKSLLNLAQQIHEGGRRKNRSRKARKTKKAKRTRRN